MSTCELNIHPRSLPLFPSCYYLQSLAQGQVDIPVRGQWEFTGRGPTPYTSKLRSSPLTRIMFYVSVHNHISLEWSYIAVRTPDKPVNTHWVCIHRHDTAHFLCKYTQYKDAHVPMARCILLTRGNSIIRVNNSVTV